MGSLTDTKMTDSIKEIRLLQATLDNAIEDYEKDPSNKGFGDKIALVATKLADNARDPFEECMKFGFRPVANVAARIACDLDLYNMIAAAGPAGMSLDEMVKKTGAQKILLIRILRMLVTTGMFAEERSGVYTGTRLSQAMTTKAINDWIVASFDSIFPVYYEIPSFIKSHGFRDIDDLNDNPCLSLHGTNFFEFLAKNPEKEKYFASAMSVQETAPPVAIAQYPFKEGIPSYEAHVKTNPEAVFFVDVGGGRGQYMSRMLKERPNDFPGKKVLQDLPGVVASVPKDVGFEAVSHDFTKPQPVKAAKFYHFRGIMHDWPDNYCVNLLEQTKPAMLKGYSKVLIQTFVLPDFGGSMTEAMMDLTMWAHCGMERSESHWYELVEKKAGMKINRIVRADVGPWGVIEVDLV